MSDATAHLDRQESEGFTLLSGAAVLLASGTLLVVAFDRSLALLGGFGVVALLLAALGYRSVAAAREGLVLEATDDLPAFDQAGHVAFWLVLSVVLLDSAVGLLRPTHVPLAYAYVGGLAFLLAYAYASVAR